MADAWRIAAVRFPARLGETDENLSRFARLARSARQQGARLICGYERCVDGCVLVRTADDTALIARIRGAAQPIPGPSTHRLCELAGELGAYLLVGMAEGQGRRYYNAAVLVSPEGHLAGVHRKTQCPAVPACANDEACVFDEGQRLEAFATPLGRLGILICYERRFPENARVLALRGAQVLVCLSAGFDGDLDVVRARARAEENGVFFVHASARGGPIVGPSGQVLAGQIPVAGDEGLVLADLDLRELSRCVAARQRYFAHRRADLHVPLADPRLATGD